MNPEEFMQGVQLVSLDQILRLQSGPASKEKQYGWTHRNDATATAAHIQLNTHFSNSFRLFSTIEGNGPTGWAVTDWPHIRVKSPEQDRNFILALASWKRELESWVDDSDMYPLEIRDALMPKFQEIFKNYFGSTAESIVSTLLA